MNIEQRIEQVLTYMTLSDVKPMHRSAAGKIGIENFDGVYPLDLVDDTAEDYMVFSDALPEDVNYSMDVKVMVNPHAFSNIEGDELQLQRVRFIKPKQARGKVKILMPVMVQHCLGYLDLNKAEIRTTAGILGYSPKGWIRLNHQDYPPPKDIIDYDTRRIRVAIGVQFTNNYYWTVYLGWDGCPGVRFPTDPTGAKEIFRLRDIPDGKKRRTAILHWVKEHYRKKRGIDARENIKIREHLRGGNVFRWNGLTCKIQPSVEEINSLPNDLRSKVLDSSMPYPKGGETQ